MPRKYVNTPEALEYNREIFDLFVATQDEKGITNDEICKNSGTTFVKSQLPRNTGIHRLNYRGEKVYTYQRDMTDVVTLYDLCRGLNPVDPKRQFLTLMLVAAGYDSNEVEKFLKKSTRKYIFKYRKIEPQV